MSPEPVGIAAQLQAALAHHRRGDLAQAEHLYRQVLAQAPAHVGALHMLGLVQYQKGLHEDAAQLIRQVTQIDPDAAAAHANLALPLFALGAFAESLASCDRALLLKPDYPEAHNNRGNALHKLKRYAEAVASYDQALRLAPEYADAVCNRGTSLMELDRHDEAVDSYNRALAANPDFAEAHCKRGVALAALGRHKDALASYDRALALQPDYADAHIGAATCCLLTGDFARGWQEYEWRWRDAHLAGKKLEFAQPLLRGDTAIGGRTVLLHAEQGIGDTVQFCRYAKLVAARGATVLLAVPANVSSLLAGLEGVHRLLTPVDPLPEFDFHCPLMSLPRVFGTTLASIPVDVPYLRSDRVRVARWRERLGDMPRPRVGLVWSGEPTHGNDRNRSIPLADLLPLVSDRARFVSLQKRLREGDARILNEHPDILQCGGELDEYADTAAVIESMDLVITVDTSTAHLAAATGKAVWIMLPFNPDWRWLLDRDDSPWYPRVRLFRQPGIGDWRSVVARVATALDEHLRKEG